MAPGFGSVSMSQNIVPWVRELFFVRQMIKIILQAILWVARHPQLTTITVAAADLGFLLIMQISTLGSWNVATHSTVAWGPSGPPTYYRPNPLTLLATFAFLGLVSLATESKRFRALTIRFCAYLEPRV